MSGAGAAIGAAATLAAGGPQAAALYLGASALEAVGADIVVDAVELVTDLLEDAGEAVVSWITGTLACWIGLCPEGPSKRRLATRKRAAMIVNSRDLDEAAVTGWLLRQGYAPLMELISSPEYMARWETPGAEYARRHAGIAWRKAMGAYFPGPGWVEFRGEARRSQMDLLLEYQAAGGAIQAAVYCYLTAGAPVGKVLTLTQTTSRSLSGPEAHRLWAAYQAVLGDLDDVPITNAAIARLASTCGPRATEDEARNCVDLAVPHIKNAALYMADEPAGETWRGLTALDQLFAAELASRPRQRFAAVIQHASALAALAQPMSAPAPKRAMPLMGSILVGGAIAVPVGLWLMRMIR